MRSIRSSRALITVVASTSALALATTVAFAQATLVSSEPAAKSVVSASPARVRLVFSEQVEPALLLIVRLTIGSRAMPSRRRWRAESGGRSSGASVSPSWSLDGRRGIEDTRVGDHDRGGADDRIDIMGFLDSAGDRARELGTRTPPRQHAIRRPSRRDYSDSPFSCR